MTATDPSTQLMPEHSVLFSSRAPIGYVAIAANELCTNQGFKSVVPNERTDYLFLYYLLRYYKDAIENLGSGTTFKEVSGSTMRNVKVKVPVLFSEQKKIASVLGAIDDKIEENERINNNLLQQAQAVFAKEFLSFDTTPEGWKESSLLGIADYLNGLAMQKFRPKDGENGLPVLKIKELRQGSCDASSELCSPSIKKEYIVHDGDVIFSWSGSLLVDFWCGGTCGLNQHLFKVTSTSFDKWFYFAWTDHHLQKFAAIAADKYPSYPLGKEPITIGLWIGGSHIPNKNVGTGERSNSAEYHLGKLQSVSSPYYVRNEKERHNKFQVLKCPWCGTKMVKDDKNGRLVGEWGYNMSGGKHFYMFCPHEDCAFTKRLPIQIIDDELYEAPPTLLFGTVDKFAMLPWDGRIGAFFGIGKDNRTPELIIQDELHLISGALGTVVGLYETAVDAICGQKGVYPKVIASTATIRRAKEQCSVLYNREVVQFPAPGLDAEDSFFAKESAVDYEKGDYGRKYVGIMPSGKTKAMMEIRTMAALMQKIYTMDLSEEVKDKLWTLTVYFNSLKDLGKASTLVDDDVKDFIVRTANRMFTGRRLIVSADELTSRVSTTALNETLDKLEKIEYSKENEAAKRYASNVLLATNMISVGIDVARLNVMLMIGQPKLTSEYIQASSRVGRSFPGVVFVQYDATKSRDRSHYERFRSYHESFYRFVEPTGATPFSRPARERALHAVLVSMMRQMTGMSEDKDAINFDKEYFADTIKQIETFVTDRVTGINERSEGQAKDDVNEIRTEIEEFFDLWQSYVDECNGEHPSVPLYFGRRFMVNPPAGDARRLLKQYNSSGKDSAVETLTSMRNVDTPVSGSIIVWGDNNV